MIFPLKTPSDEHRRNEREGTCSENCLVGAAAAEKQGWMPQRGTVSGRQDLGRASKYLPPIFITHGVTSHKSGDALTHLQGADATFSVLEHGVKLVSTRSQLRKE